MSRRRLSQQQSRRIAARHRDVVDDDAVDSTAQPGLVIARHGKTVVVENQEGTQHRCHLRSNLPPLVAGDRVRWAPDNDATGVVLAREPRDNALHRPDPRGNLRPVAANIDWMLIVIAPVPEPHANLIDRYLVAAEHEAIPCALVLNKSDLLEDNEQIPALIRRYEALGYPVVTTGKNDPEARALRDLIADKTLVFVGQSGVGKSSIIQRLLPDFEIRVGALSDAAGKGRHTTTTAELFHLPRGGHLIDSPGIREFHLNHITPEAVAMGFREFRPFIGQCQFRDCSHQHEKNCALLAAVERGEISSVRFESYRRIIDSLNEGK